MNEKLNRKLVEFAGLPAVVKIIEDTIIFEDQSCIELFTLSESTCVRHLVPKVWERGFQVILAMLSPGNSLAKIVDVFGKADDIVALEGTPALAICKAVEKMLDKKVK